MCLKKDVKKLTVLTLGRNKMTDKEFEDYLKSIGGLENGWYPKDEINSEKVISSRGFFSISDGWLQLVRDCIQELINAGWNKRVQQVKEKFGGLRFYCEGDGTYSDIIDKYEKLSYETCESCGSTENVTSGPIKVGYWIRTLCHECRSYSMQRLSNENI